MDDMTMARRADATAVGVLTGAAERSRLRKAGAHWVADTMPTVVKASGRV
jgi:phosphoglycolate phosphatase-like HAD superfamily hydrolase